MGRGEEREATIHTGHFESTRKMCLCHLVTSHLNEHASLFFPSVPYGRLNSDDVWARRKSRRLPMIPGGIYSSKSGKDYFTLRKKKVFMEVRKQYTNFIASRTRDKVQTK